VDDPSLAVADARAGDAIGSNIDDNRRGFTDADSQVNLAQRIRPLVRRVDALVFGLDFADDRFRRHIARASAASAVGNYNDSASICLENRRPILTPMAIRLRRGDSFNSRHIAIQVRAALRLPKPTRPADNGMIEKPQEALIMVSQPSSRHSH
jgi:hypothetical protein